MNPADRRVSVLFPCRDAAAHLPEAIASIRDQTFEAYEVLAVDDGSTDLTRQLLHAWADEDPRVRLLRTPRRGLVPALASALAAARCALVARMDADDVAEPDRLAQQVALLDRDPSVAACGTGVEYFPPEHVRNGAMRYQAWLNSLCTPEDIARDVFVECPLAHPTLMIRRSVLLAVGGYRELDWPEDYDLVLRVWAAGHRLPPAHAPGSRNGPARRRWRRRPPASVRRTERPDRCSASPAGPSPACRRRRCRGGTAWSRPVPRRCRSARPVPRACRAVRSR